MLADHSGGALRRISAYWRKSYKYSGSEAKNLSPAQSKMILIHFITTSTNAASNQTLLNTYISYYTIWSMLR